MLATIIFKFSVKIKEPHYSFAAFFALSFLSACLPSCLPLGMSTLAALGALDVVLGFGAAFGFIGVK